MSEPKKKANSLPGLREPKKRLNLSVPPALRMPHDDLIKPEAPGVGVQQSPSVGVQQPQHVGASDTDLAGLHIVARAGAHGYEIVGVHESEPAGAHDAQPVGEQNSANPDTQPAIVGSHSSINPGVHGPGPGVNEPAHFSHVGGIAPTKKKSERTQKKSVGVHSTDRHSQDKAKVNFYLTKDKVREFKVFAAESEMSLTEFFERAGSHYMETVGVRRLKSGGVNTPHDELINNKTLIDIIKLYKHYTGNRWKPADDHEGKRFNEADRRLIELGILNTYINLHGGKDGKPSRTKLKKINSFAYFAPEIEEVQMVKLGDETIDLYIKLRRQQWEKLKATLELSL